MASQSKKHDKFVAEEIIGDKLVKDLSGIGPAYGKELSNEGHKQAYQVLGKFVAVVEDETEFDNWLNASCKANKQQRKNCYECLQEWCRNYRRCDDS